MGFFFTITTHHHTNPYNPSKSTSGVSWRLPDTAVLLPGLGSISKMLSSLTLYQFYILHCVYIERKKDKGEEKIMASCIRGGEIKRRSSRSLSKFRLTLHPLSLIPYFTYFQVLEQVKFWGNSSQSCDLNIYERGYKIKGIQFLTLGHNIFSVFRNRWSKK